MNSVSRMIATSSRIAAMVVLLAMAGCVGVDRSIDLTEARVTGIPAGDGRFVSAPVLAKAMLRAGFTPKQILRDGPDVEVQLAKVGGAQVRYGKVTAALFAVHDDLLYVSSSTNGTFIEPLKPS